MVYYFLQNQIKQANEFLASQMGLMINRASRDKIPITLTKDEIQMYIKRFQVIDKDNKGYVSINDIRRSLKVISSDLIVDILLGRSSILPYSYNEPVPWTPRINILEQTLDRKVSTEEIHGILNEIDTTYNGRLEMSDYLQVNEGAVEELI